MEDRGFQPITPLLRACEHLGPRASQPVAAGNATGSVPAVARTDDTVSAGRPALRGSLHRFIFKPLPEDPAPVARPRSRAELEDEHRYANDKERMIGLVAAPFGAAIAVLVVSALIAHDPAALPRSGMANPKHVSVTLYEELLGVLAMLCVAMLGLAWFRKRLFLGMVMALFGLAVFNLHYWGFGVPFVMAGAWLLVRAYRIQRDLKATGWSPRDVASPRRSRRDEAQVVVLHAKRFTPPTSPRKRTSAVGR